MKTILMLGTTLVLGTVVHAAGGYVRPELAIFDPSGQGTNGTWQGSVALGHAFGAAERHELELAVGWAAWDRDYSSIEEGSPYTGRSENESVSILVNYRFVPAVSDTMRVYLEVGLGCAPSSAEWNIAWESGGVTRGEGSETCIAASVGAGLSWEFAERTSLLLGIQFISVLAAESAADDDIAVTDIGYNAGLVKAGLRFAF